MKKNDKFILLLLGFVVILVVATIGYRFLSKQYLPQEVPFSVIENEVSSDTQPEDADIPNTENASTEDSTPDTVKMKAPDFTVYDLEGNPVSLYSNLGKPVVINFWATWCGPCQSEMPAFDKMYQEYGDEVTFLMINVTDGSRDTKESVTTFYEDSEYSFPIYLDTTLDTSMTYGAYSIPVTFFLDAEGYLLYNHRGAISEEALEQCMELLVQTASETTAK